MKRLRALDKGRLSILAVVLVATTALVTRDQWDWLLQDGSIQTEGVVAETITDVDEETERLYRIGDSSSVSYQVQENLGGLSSTAIGTTSAVGGDIVINTVDPSQSRIGTIVVNIETFESDSSLRDKRMRLDYLESREFPFATFEPTSIDGISSDAVEGQTYPITVVGDLTVKETTAPATFAGTVTFSVDRLEASMATGVLMSTFDIGPIHVAGLVHTSDTVTLTFSLVADRVELGSTPVSPNEFAGNVTETLSGEFAATVQPILEQNCVACHAVGGPGYSTVALETAGDAADIASGIGVVTQALYMPPWPAGDGGLDFAHDWSLDDNDLATLTTWAAAGGGLDVDRSTPLASGGDQLRAIAVDTVGATQAYAGSLDQVNDYRCRAIEVGDPEGVRWIRSLQFAPDNLAVTHHGLLFSAPASSREQLADLEAEDAEAGWSCFGLSGVGGAALVSSWAPGTQPFEMPEGSGIRLAPNDFMIVQIHYHFDDETPLDAPSILFDIASEDELAAAGGSLRPLQYEIYLAPAEIPCTADETGPLCDRGAVMSALIEDYGDFAGVIPGGLLAQCNVSLRDLLADTDGIAHSSCDREVPAGEVVTLWPHMHEFGASYRMTLNPGTSDEQVLIDIPTWSFDWQIAYSPSETFVFEAGDVLRVECTWDRSLSYQPEPRYITWNEGTEDEMCWTSIATLPVDG